MIYNKNQSAQVNPTGLNQHTNKLMVPAWARTKKGIYNRNSPEAPKDDDYNESSK